MTNFTYTGSIEFDTIASSGLYEIAVDGAQGGSNGGLGADVGGDIYLTAGTTLELIVGGEGASGGAGGAGGGGGSFVFETYSGTAAITPLLIAGGGGGGGLGGGGRASPTGGAGGSLPFTSGAGAGGVNGAAGSGSSNTGGGGGGGYTGGGGGGGNGRDAGTSFQGGAGDNGGAGGFGGGGGGGRFAGGGGGGFGGGGGGAVAGGGGGGSYLNPGLSYTSELGGVRAGNGDVVITPVLNGITLSAGGPDTSPFTLGSTGIIHSTGHYGVFSTLSNPSLSVDGAVAAPLTGVDFTNGGSVTTGLSTASIYGETIGVSIAGQPGSITNLGTIGAHFGDGLALTAGAVSNLSGALIYGATGISIGSAGAQLANAGTVLGKTGDGVYFKHGGTVSNAGTITGAGAAISFASGGDLLAVYAGAVINGDVLANGSGNTLSFEAGAGSLGGIGGQITGFQTLDFNPGADWTVSGVAAGFNNGTINGFIRQDTLDLTNLVATPGNLTLGANGTLEIPLTGGGDLSFVISAADGGALFALSSNGAGGTDITEVTDSLASAQSAGILLSAPGPYVSPFTVTPTGTITTSGNYGVSSGLAGPTLTVEGSIFAGSDGVHFADGGTVINSGAINGARQIGIYLQQGGYVGSAAGARIAGHNFGVDITAEPGSLVNAGTIIGYYVDGVDLAGGGTVTNAGTIAGGAYAVLFGGTGNNLLQVAPGAVFSGLVHAAGTHNTLAFGPGAGSLGGFGSLITGFQTLDFDPGAAWTLAGSASSFSGLTLEGLAAGDTLDLLGIVATPARLTLGANNTLAIPIAGGGTFDLALSAADGGKLFGVTSNGAGGTDVSELSNDLATATSSGITLSSAGPNVSPFTVTNTGTVASTSHYGFYSSISQPTLTVDGTVTGGIIGVDFTAGGTVATGLPAAFIYGVVAGISAGNQPGSVANLGTIGAHTGDGVALGSGAVANLGTAALIYGGNGIYIKSAGALVTNAGTIIGRMIDGVKLANGGTVTDSGTISGAANAVYFGGAGQDLLLLEPGAVLNGLVTATGTENVLELGAGSGSLAGIGGQINGFQTLDFAAGAGWIVSGLAAGFASGTIEGFGLTGTLDLTNLAATPAQLALSADGTLDIPVTGGGHVDLTISTADGGTRFAISADGHGGTELTEIITSLASASTTGITLTSLGPDASPFTVTATGTIATSGGFGVYSEIATPSLSNAGSINAHLTGVMFRDGGTISNNGPASLSGGEYGVVIQSAAGIVTNSGTILGGSAGGVYLGGGGTVDNALAVAQIIGGGKGVMIYNSPATVLNAGTIVGTKYDGIVAYAGGSVTNTGASALIKGANFGVYMQNVAGTVANAGTILATGGTGFFVGTGTGIYLGAGGTLSNSGTISGTEAAVQFGATGTDLLEVASSGVFDGAVTARGTHSILALGAGASTLSGLGGTITGFQTLEFDSGAAWTVSGGLGGFASLAIEGFSAQDTIDVTNLVTTPAQLTLSTTGILGIPASGGGTTDLTISAADGGTLFVAGSDGHGGTDITEVTGLLANSTATGITLTAIGPDTSPFTVAQTGTVSTSGNFGISSGIGAASLSNSGAVAGHNAGVYFTNGGTISNQAGGRLSGGQYGVEIAGGPGKVVNDGSISGVGLFYTGTVINALSSSQIMGTRSGVFGTVGTVANYGTLTGAQSYGVVLYTGGVVTNFGSSATLSGGIDGVVIGFGAGDSHGAGTVVNSGTIAGGKDSIYFRGAGASRLVVDPGAVFIGKAVADVLAPATLEFAAGTGSLSGIGSSFTGFETLSFDPGAAWTLLGNAAGLAGGETITGFTFGDAIELTGFTATSEMFVAGSGLTLSNGGTTETLDLSGSFPGGQFALSTNSSGTVITLELAAGGTVAAGSTAPLPSGSLASATIAGGTLEVSGGSTLGSLAVTGSGSAVSLASGAALTVSAPLTIAPGATLNIAGGTLVVDGSISLTGAITESGTDLLDNGSLVNNGNISLDPSTLTIEGSLSGTGVTTLGAGSTLDVTGNISAGQAIVFAGTAAELQITGTADIAGTLSLTDTAATIDITDLALASFTSASFNSISDLLGITFSGAGSPLELHGDFAGYELAHRSDGASGTELIETPLCYLRGTRILTPTGEVPVEDLRIGDVLVTRFGGFQKVKWIGRQTRDPRATRELREIAPVRIRAGALGHDLPARDLFVSPGHSMLVGENLLLAKLLVNGVTVTQDITSSALIEYFQVEFETHDCIIAEGAWSESFADGPGLRAAFDNEAEFYARYPDARPPEELTLCAPRPERGARLDAALRPIVTRAAASAEPGALRGWAERIIAPWTVEGWASDESHPELPVELEFLLDGQVIGSVLSCAYRPDLAQAGLGAGRCAFNWTAPVTLPPDALSRLHIRRVRDGAALPGSAALPSAKTMAPALRLVG